MASSPSTKQRGWQWLAVVVWASFLLIVSTLPSRRLPKLQNWSDLIGTDKLAHALVYAVFAVLLYLPMRFWQIKVGLWAFLLSALYGVFMEVLQASLSTGRAYEPADMLANAIGAALGVFILQWWVRRTTK